MRACNRGLVRRLRAGLRELAHAHAEQAQRAREELRHVVGFSVADELSKLDQLKKSGSITDTEYGRLRTKLVS